MVVSPYKFRIATDDDELLWDNFVLSHVDGSFFHRFCWGRILEEGKVGKRLYFILEKGRSVAAIFPAFMLHKPVRSMRSLPFSDYGSPLLSNSEDVSSGFLTMLDFIKSELLKRMCLFMSFRLPASLSVGTLGGSECRLSNYSVRLSTIFKSEDDI
ncbi:hypothetical protein MUP77_06840, partial [Candidatus Bathyarchaeota archaeon]|nr:hypothetical protein [Candidatus Bathyarchaeota archaeon]